MPVNCSPLRSHIISIYLISISPTFFLSRLVCFTSLPLPRPTPDWKRCVKGIPDLPVFVFSLPAFPREESVFWFSYLVTLYLPTRPRCVPRSRSRLFAFEIEITVGLHRTSIVSPLCDLRFFQDQDHNPTTLKEMHRRVVLALRAYGWGCRLWMYSPTLVAPRSRGATRPAVARAPVSRALIQALLVRPSALSARCDITCATVSSPC